MTSMAPSQPETADDRVLARLEQLEREVADGNRIARTTGSRFMIFAVFALLLAMVSLIVVATKLDGSSSPSASAGGSPAAQAPTTSPAAATAPTPAARIGVSLKEYSVGLSNTVGRAGPVTFMVRNDGRVLHEFVVLRTAKPAASLLKGTEADETGNVGEIGDVQPGAAKTLRLRLRPGHYALICNLSGHYKAGQHADFTVR